MDFEVFKVGTHTSDLGITKDYSLDDLRFMAESYNPKDHEAPIVLGHPKHDTPAMGWIESLSVAGDKLVASTKNLIPEFLDAVKNGLFKKRSISLFSDGKLRHVGFLGGAIPAVKGLADIQFSEGDYSTFEFESENFNETNAEQSKSPNQNISNQLSQILENLKSLNQSFSDNSVSKDELQKVYNSVTDLNMKIQTNNFEKTLNDKIISGSLTPAMKDKILGISNYLQTQNFSELDHNSIHKNVTGLLTDFVNSIPKFLKLQNFAEKETRINSTHKDEFENLLVDEQSASLHKEVVLLMQKENIPYVNAVNKLINKN